MHACLGHYSIQGSPKKLRGGDTSLLQPCGDYRNRLVNCGYYEISGYRHAQNMTNEFM